jgi:hypothetical protein
MAHAAMVTTIPDATLSTRGELIVRRPTRSPSQISGRNSGPWLEKTVRNGASPARIAKADAANTASSNTSDLAAK